MNLTKTANGINLSESLHRCVHNAENDTEVEMGKKIKKQCMETALARYEGKFRYKLIKMLKEDYGHDWIGFDDPINKL